MRLVSISGPSRTLIPRSRSCFASARRVGPARPERSSVGSPPSSSCQPPRHLPLSESREPRPITRVAMRAPPPARARVNPVVNTLTVEAGMSSRCGSTLQRTRPSMVPMATPHSPPTVRVDVRRNHSSTAASSAGESVWAARFRETASPPRAKMTSVVRRRWCIELDSVGVNTGAETKVPREQSSSQRSNAPETTS